MGYGYGFMGSWVGWYQPIPIPMDTHTHNPCGLPIPMSFPNHVGMHVLRGPEELGRQGGPTP